jgi:methyl-accepting chemotaxis protein
VAVIGVSVWATAGLGSAHRRVSDQVFPQVIAADMTMAAALNMHFSQAAYVLDPNAELAGAPAHATFEVDYQAFKEQLAQLKLVTDSRVTADLDRVVAASDRWAAFDKQLWAAVQAGKSGEAKALVMGAANETNDVLVNALTTYQQDIGKVERQANQNFNSTQSSSTWIMGAVGGVAVLVALLLAFLIGRALVGGIRQMLAAAEGIAEGDVDQEVVVRSKDELGATASAFQRMIGYLKETAAAADRIAAGDLTVEVEPKSERDALRHAFAKMVGNLRSTIEQVAGAAGEVGSSSRQMAFTSAEAGRAVGEIATAVGDVAEGAERQVRSGRCGWWSRLARPRQRPARRPSMRKRPRSRASRPLAKRPRRWRLCVRRPAR